MCEKHGSRVVEDDLKEPRERERKATCELYHLSLEFGRDRVQVFRQARRKRDKLLARGLVVVMVNESHRGWKRSPRPSQVKGDSER